MNLEPKARAFVAALETANLPRIEDGSPEQARAMMRGLRRSSDHPQAVRMEDHHASHVPVRVYSAAPRIAATVLYLHGGGWVLGELADVDIFCGTLVQSADIRVVAVDYRLAPEHRFPAAIEDSTTALEWVLQRYPENPLILLGDSAGGNLAAVLAIEARDRGGPPITAQILAYPVTDAAMTSRSFTDFAEAPLLSAGMMRWFWDQYAPAGVDRSDPRLSPINAALHDLAPTLILTAENDPLRDEGEAFGAALREAGSVATIERFSGQIHGFVTLGLFDGSVEALRRITTFIDDQIAANSYTTSNAREV